jgi:hypothetical protein
MQSDTGLSSRIIVPFDAQTMAAHFQQKMNGYAAPVALPEQHSDHRILM